MVYVTIITVILLITVWFIPKRMQRKDMYITWITMAFVELELDIFLGSPVLGLYYFAGEDKVSPEALGIKLILGPLFGILFVNFMPKDFKKFIPYWIFWTAFSTFFEWTTVLFGYLTYTGWKLWYSAVFFALIIPLFRWHYLYTKHS